MMNDIATPRQWAVYGHLSGLLNLSSIPFAAAVGAGLVYGLHANESDFTRKNAVNALNFQITVAIVHVLWLAAFIALFIVVFFPELAALRHMTPAERAAAPFPLAFFGWAFGLAGLYVVVNLLTVIYSVVGAVAANNGRVFRYATITFVR